MLDLGFCLNCRKKILARALSKESCELTGFLTRGHAGGLSAGNHVSLQDSLTRGLAGGLSAEDHVNLQDSLS